jgi:hypothetical protein
VNRCRSARIGVHILPFWHPLRSFCRLGGRFALQPTGEPTSLPESVKLASGRLPCGRGFAREPRKRAAPFAPQRSRYLQVNGAAESCPTVGKINDLPTRPFDKAPLNAKEEFSATRTSVLAGQRLACVQLFRGGGTRSHHSPPPKRPTARPSAYSAGQVRKPGDGEQFVLAA